MKLRVFYRHNKELGVKMLVETPQSYQLEHCSCLPQDHGTAKLRDAQIIVINPTMHNHVGVYNTALKPKCVHN